MVFFAWVVLTMRKKWLPIASVEHLCVPCSNEQEEGRSMRVTRTLWAIHCEGIVVVTLL